MRWFKTLSIRVFFKKNGLLKKNHDFIKKCRGSKFAVEYEKSSKTSQKVRKIWAGLDKKMGFLRKNLSFSKNGYR